MGKIINCKIAIAIFLINTPFLYSRPPGECIEGDCQNGHGAFRFKTDGDTSPVYRGQFKNGEFHGEAVFENGNSKVEALFQNGRPVSGKEWAQGALIFEGEWNPDGNWKRGKHHYTTDSGAECYYTGGFLNGKYHGMGELSCNNSLHYKGNFLNGKYSGKGVYEWGSIRYAGDFVAGNRHGKGKLYRDDKLIYDGNWKDDEKNFVVANPDFIFRTREYPDKWTGGQINFQVKLKELLPPDHDAEYTDETGYVNLDADDRIFIRGWMKTTDCCGLNAILLADGPLAEQMEKILVVEDAKVKIQGVIIASYTTTFDDKPLPVILVKSIQKK
jgi:hypothetical protein